MKIGEVEKYCNETGGKLPSFNSEIKYNSAVAYGRQWIIDNGPIVGYFKFWTDMNLDLKKVGEYMHIRRVVHLLLTGSLNRKRKHIRQGSGGGGGFCHGVVQLQLDAACRVFRFCSLCRHNFFSFVSICLYVHLHRYKYPNDMDRTFLRIYSSHF